MKPAQPSSHSNARRSRYQLPLQSILIASFVIPVVSAISLTGYLSYRNGQQATEDLARQLMGEASERVQNQLSTYLSNAQVINRLNANAIQTGQLNLQDPNALTRHFWQQRFLFDNVCGSAMYFGTPQGEFTGFNRHLLSNTWRIGRSGHSTQGHYFSYATDAQGRASTLLKRDILFDPRVRPWYRAATKARKTTWSEVYPDISQQSLKIALSQPVYDATGKLQGVLGVDCLFSKINDLLRQAKVGQSGVIFIIERSGALIASSTDRPPFNQQNRRLNISELNQPVIQRSAKLLQDYGALAETRQNQAFEFHYSGQLYFLHVTPLSKDAGLNWQIVVVVPESDFMARANANTATTLWLCLGALSLAIAVGIFTARRVTRPIIQMSAASHKIVSGELEQPIAGSAIQEVKNLADAFNWMSQQIKDSRQQLQDYARSLEEKVSERTQALEHEIQQHKQTETALQQRARQDQLLSSISRTFLNQDTEAAIADTLQKLANFTDSNRCYILKYDSDLREWSTTHEWCANGINSFKPIFQRVPLDHFFWAWGQVLNGQVVHVPSVADLPPEATPEKNALALLGIQSFVLVPIIYNSKVYGLIGLNHVHARKTWNPEHIQLVQVVGELITIAQIRKLAEEALRESETKYRDLVQAANSIIMRWDTTGHIKFLNQYGLKFFGFQESEILGRHVIGTIASEMEASGRDLRALMADICQNPANYQDNENENIRSDGKKVWVKWANKAILNEQGELIEILSAGFDISERKRVEEALFESELRLRSILENVNDVIYILNPDGTFAYLSPSLTDALQYEPVELVGNHFAPIIHPDYVQLCTDAVQGLVETSQTVWGLEYLVKHKDGSWCWHISNISAVQDDAGNVLYCVGMARDVTQRKVMEEELRQAKAAADAASKAKSEFLANMSHELRSPLNAILGFSQLLHRSQTLNPEQQENVDTIIHSGEHLLTLINNVLDLSKIEAGQTTLNENDFDLHQLLHDVETMFTLRAEEKQLQLVCDRHSQVPQYIRTDQVKLRQVLINLLSNAIKFTEQGKITLRVMPEDADIRLPKAEPSSTSASQVLISFEIEDTGIGIAPEEINDLFIAFSQTQSGKTHEGTGLGLAISRQFVELMGGTISVSSVLHQGTTFRFNIQAAIVASVGQRHPVRQVIGLEPGQSDYRILVVDDKPVNRQLLVKLLSPFGFELQEASNGQEAIAIFQEWEPHLIWMDMRMPVMDGYEATKQIKATTKGQATAVIALTASALEEQKAIVLSAGCDGFIRKPFQQAEIFAAMQEHIGVRYIYASEASSSQTEINSQPILSGEAFSEQLRSLSPHLINELHTSLHNVDLDSLSGLIQEIRNTNSELASTLKKQIDNFEYEQILAAIQMIH